MIVYARAMTMLDEWKNRLVVFTVLGDAEAFVVDWSALSDAQKKDFAARHLGAFVQNIEKRKRSLSEFTPIALIGQSMPDEVLETVDLSADHEGTLIAGNQSGRLFYVAAGDDPCAYLAYDSAAEMAPRGSFRDEPFDPKTLTFGGEPTQKTGFTLAEWKMAKGGLAMVIGKKSGLMGVIERVFASS